MVRFFFFDQKLTALNYYFFFVTKLIFWYFRNKSGYGESEFGIRYGKKRRVYVSDEFQGRKSICTFLNNF